MKFITVLLSIPGASSLIRFAPRVRTVGPALTYGWVRTQGQDNARGFVLKATDVPESAQDRTIETETLIIGGGLGGTATAFALGERGVKTVLVEQGQSIAPPQASSNGDSRMYRKMYSNEFFSKMQSKALDRWQDLEKITGEDLLQENGLLFYGEDTGETVEGSVLGAKQVMEKLNLPHTFYASGNEIAERYPALAGCKGRDYSGVCEDTAGHIRATKACTAMLKAAGDHCDVHLSAKIISLDVNDGGGAITATKADGTTIRAKNAVLACGPWTNEVLALAGLPRLNLDIWMVQWAHYEVEASVAATIPQAFYFKKENGIDGGLYYVFPASATESVSASSSSSSSSGKSYVKVGVDFPTGEALGSMDEFNYEGSAEVLKLMDGWVLDHLPLVGTRIDSYCSPYTMTPDSYFVMDKVGPPTSNLAVFAGGSGRAFKFGPLLGDCMAAILYGGEAPVDLEPFSLKREAMVSGVPAV